MSQRRFGRQAWLAGVAVLLPIAFFSALPWLKTKPDSVVLAFAAVAAIGTMLASALLALLRDSAADEWQRSGEGFALKWGLVSGAGIFVAMLALPLFQGAIIETAAQLAEVTNPDTRLIIMTFAIGAGFVVLLQVICALLIGLGWRMKMIQPDDA